MLVHHGIGEKCEIENPPGLENRSLYAYHMLTLFSLRAQPQDFWLPEGPFLRAFSPASELNPYTKAGFRCGIQQLWKRSNRTPVRLRGRKLSSCIHRLSTFFPRVRRTHPSQGRTIKAQGTTMRRVGRRCCSRSLESEQPGVHEPLWQRDYRHSVILNPGRIA